jgi:glutathione S-transferase
MITLYTFGPAFGLPDPSPFVMKAEVLLKMAGLPYEAHPKGRRGAPKGKLPYIDDDGERIADSTLIRWHIENKYGVDFDGNLNSEERAVAWTAERMLEDHLYWAVVDAHWCDDRNFRNGPAQFFRGIPWPLRGLAESIMRRRIASRLKAHGLGRHSQQEIAALAARDIDALAALLADQPYLMGKQPCGADATAFAFVAALLCPHFNSVTRTATERQPNLVAYSVRMMREFYPAIAYPKLEKAA